MNGLMNGKPYIGMRRVQTSKRKHSGLDYKSIRQLVQSGIEKGLITPPLSFRNFIATAKSNK